MLDTVNTGTPRKVLHTAHTLGVHNDCLVADASGACARCLRIMHESFMIHYGHFASSDLVSSAILADLILDQWDE